MSKSGQPFEVPKEMREMFDRGLAQAREGFEKAMEAAGETAAAVEKRAGEAKSRMADLQKSSLSFAEQNVAAAFDLAEKLLGARSPDEAMKVQAEFLSNQAARAQAHFTETGKALQAQAQAQAAALAADTQAMQSKAKETLQSGLKAAEMLARQGAEAAQKASKKGK